MVTMVVTLADKAGTEEQTYLLFPLKGKTLNQFKIGVFPSLSHTILPSLSFYFSHTHTQTHRHTDTHTHIHTHTYTHTYTYTHINTQTHTHTHTFI